MRIEEEGRGGRTLTEGALTPFPHLRPSSPRPSLTCKSGGIARKVCTCLPFSVESFPLLPFSTPIIPTTSPREAYLTRPLPNEENNPPRGMQSNLARFPCFPIAFLPCLARRKRKRKHSLSHTLIWSTTKRIFGLTHYTTLPITQISNMCSATTRQNLLGACQGRGAGDGGCVCNSQSRSKAKCAHQICRRGALHS